MIVYFTVVEGQLFSRGQLKNNFGANPKQTTIKTQCAMLPRIDQTSYRRQDLHYGWI